MRTVIVAALLAALGLASSVQAGELRPSAVAPSARAFRVGDLHLWTLSDAQLVVPNDGKTFGLDAGADAVAEVLKSADAPTDQITLSVDALLLKVGKLNILFDTGFGAAHHGVLHQSLEQAGVAPEDVTEVLITHPHLDHIGGLVTARGTSAFPEAVVRISEAGWTRLQREAPRIAKVIASQVRTFEPGTELVPDVVRSVSLPGHAPGHTGYEIISGRTRLLDIGDLVHSSVVSLAKPQWLVEFDEDRKGARATRVMKLKELARTHERVFSPHFPFPGTGLITLQEDGFAWKPDGP
jgi:glyoxylase-like metal-dependent hydrolase (beta-lactamase superfamily II)